MLFVSYRQFLFYFTKKSHLVNLYFEKIILKKFHRFLVSVKYQKVKMQVDGRFVPRKYNKNCATWASSYAIMQRFPVLQVKTCPLSYTKVKKS